MTVIRADLCLVLLLSLLAAGDMENPAGLVAGGGFRDRILPMPIHDGLESEGIRGCGGPSGPAAGPVR